MSVVFADAGFWIALIDPSDTLYETATARMYLHEPDTILTTELVLVEVLASVSRAGPALREAGARLVRDVLADESTEVVRQTRALFLRALDRFENRLDQSWSLVDCASFLVMEERGITDALAYDRDFEQAGFVALLRNTSA